MNFHIYRNDKPTQMLLLNCNSLTKANTIMSYYNDKRNTFTGRQINNKVHIEQQTNQIVDMEFQDLQIEDIKYTF